MAALLAAAPAAAAEDPWRLLAELRTALERASPLAADFEQSFRPAGFDSADVERGVVYLALPRCARWDYDEPFPKSFLLCGELAFSWNPGEAAGRRTLLDPGEEPGLDLLRLDVDGLGRRYRAEILELAGAETEIRLEPLAPLDVRDARLRFDAAAGRLLEIRWADPDGNLSRFVLSGYRAAATEGLFEPPDGLEWIAD